MQRYPLAAEMIPTAEVVANVTALLAAMSAVDLDVDVHLLDAAPPGGPDVDWADLSEASFAGYTLKTATVASFTLDQVEADGSIRLASTTLLAWPGPTDDVPVTIYGVAFTEGGGTTRLYRIQVFDEPVTLPNDSTILPVIGTMTFKGGLLAN